ncbi:MAG: hypothetical protein J6X53_09605 [Abditibacteriota bacterium]|nr:hypothetical protein [Abditibacteriota bacterium]
MQKPSKEEMFEYYKNMANTKELSDGAYVEAYQRMFNAPAFPYGFAEDRTMEDVKNAVKTGKRLPNPAEDMPGDVLWD